MNPVSIVSGALVALLLISLSYAEAIQPVTPPPDPAEDCVTAKDVVDELTKNHHPPGPLLSTPMYFLPAGGGPVQVILHQTYKDGNYYFGAILPAEKTRVPYRLDKGGVAASKIPENSPYVLGGLANKDETLLTFSLPDTLSGPWYEVDLYVYTCGSAPTNPVLRSPNSVSSLTTRVSSWRYSSAAAWSFMIAVYLLSAFASHAADKNPATWYRYLDPVYMTAGSDGKGSMSKLQILWFSTIVAGMLAYIVARTGVLSNLSSTILLLLGIAGVGSAAAKGTDVRFNRLDPDNAAWLVQKGWLPHGGLPATNAASWHDIITSDGEFDVYRYQNLIFSLIVGLSLLAGGINQLASFEIPQTLLGILGLSQVVYIGGKLVTPTSLADLNTAINELRDLEKKAAAATVAAAQAEAAGEAATTATKKRAAEEARLVYSEKEQRVRIQFELATGRSLSEVPGPAPGAA